MRKWENNTHTHTPPELWFPLMRKREKQKTQERLNIYSISPALNTPTFNRRRGENTDAKMQMPKNAENYRKM